VRDHETICSPGTDTGVKMHGMAADAATASGSGPLLMQRCCPSRSTTPTCRVRLPASKSDI